MMVVNLDVARMAVWATAVQPNLDANLDMYAGWCRPTVDAGWRGSTADVVDGWLAYCVSVVHWIGLGITLPSLLVQKLAVETQTGIQIAGSTLSTGPVLPTQVAQKWFFIGRNRTFQAPDTRLCITKSVVPSP
jgi:hypothetical protein